MASEFETSLGPGTTCVSHLDSLSSSYKIQRNYMEPNNCVNAPLGQILDQKDTRQKTQLPFLKAECKAGNCTQHHRGNWAPQPDPCIHLTPDKELSRLPPPLGSKPGNLFLFSLIPAASKGAAPMKPLIFSCIYLFLVAPGLCHFLAFSPVARVGATL